MPLTKRWRAVLDEHTCPACRAAHGQTADDRREFMPLPSVPPHPACTSENGCRCVVVEEPPIVDASSYATAEEADAYFKNDRHISTSTPTAEQEQMAMRLLDHYVDFT